MLAHKKTQSPNAVAAKKRSTLSRFHSAVRSLLLRPQLLYHSRLIAANTYQETLSLSVRAQVPLMLRSAGRYGKHIH